MADLKKDERGFIKAGNLKLCRASDGNIEFLARGRGGRRETVVVPLTEFVRAAKNDPLPNSDDSANVGDNSP